MHSLCKSRVIGEQKPFISNQSQSLSEVTKEFILEHINLGVIADKPSQYSRCYYPTTQDLQNITKKFVVSFYRVPECGPFQDFRSVIKSTRLEQTSKSAGN